MEWYIALMLTIIGFPIACGIGIGIILIIIKYVTKDNY